jgi:kumamolisin
VFVCKNVRRSKHYLLKVFSDKAFTITRQKVVLNSVPLRMSTSQGNPKESCSRSKFQLKMTKGNTMTHASKLLTVAAAAVLGSVVAAPVANAQRIIIPHSNIERPEDIGRRAHTNIRYANPQSTSPGPTFETPASIACVYNLVARVSGCPISGTTANPSGGSRTIAIVDAFDNPKAASDLATFSAQFGLPAANFQQVFASGTKPPNDPGGWSLEIALDIEWAHAMAPNAKILLVEAASNSFDDLYAAEALASSMVAAAGGGQVTNSWSGGEYNGELADEASFFSTPGVVYFASTGDSGLNAIGVPAVFKNVIAAGGTKINRSGGKFTGETYWTNGGGGGTSIFEPIPSYQQGRAGITGTKRTIPDFSSDADPNSGVAVFDADGGFNWLQVGGTSVSSPSLAGMINLAGHFVSSAQVELKHVYDEYSNATQYKQFWRDVTTGDSHCKVGYDICTGIGVPNGVGGK